MLNRFVGGVFFAFLLISLGIVSPTHARDVADDPDGGDEIAVVSDPDGGDEVGGSGSVSKGTKGTINVTVGAVDEAGINSDPDGGDEATRTRMSANEASASGALKTIAS